MKSLDKTDKRNNLAKNSEICEFLDNLVVKGLSVKRNSKPPLEGETNVECAESLLEGYHELLACGDVIEECPFDSRQVTSKREIPEKGSLVMAEMNDESQKRVQVKVVSLNLTKEWLGGFKDKKTGKEFHNASTQTTYSSKHAKRFLAVTRDVQAHLYVMDHSTQGSANKATQMAVPGFFADPRTDKYMAPGHYEFEAKFRTFEEVKNEKAIIIQKWYRQLKGKLKLRAQFLSMIDDIKSEKLKNKVEKDLLIADRLRVLIKKSFPKTRNNFFILFAMLEGKWKDVNESLKEIGYPAKKVAELYHHLMNYINCLYDLEAQRIKGKEEALNRKQMKLLEDQSQSIIRKDPKWQTVVDNLPVQRAREIKEIFILYKRRDATKNQRLEVLINLRSVIESFEDFDHARDFIEIIDTEIDMINRGIPLSLLEGLRKRGEEIFMWHVKQENFNPNGKNYNPKAFPKLKHKWCQCKACLLLKDPSMFPLHVRLMSYWECAACEWLRMTAHVTINLAPYSFILKMLRHDEAKKGPLTIYANLLQPFGAYYLVNEVWNGRSAISESSYVYELRLVRWNQRKDWSPWNCILMTQEEAGIHEKINRNEDIYESDFIQSVKLKNINCKWRFCYLYWTQLFTEKSGIYNSTVEENCYAHPFRCKESLQFKDPFFNPPPVKAFVSTTIKGSFEKGFKIKDQ